VVIQPGLQVGGVEVERAACLLDQRQRMGAGVVRLAETVQLVALAETEGGWLQGFGRQGFAGRVVDGKTPR